ncbi:hypothetical protein QYF61_004339 [Mycteria americana]|uniref:Uncharacterized protein n=1 Tax=Mycteria americana TaxID=33587 RepID=A0AAN7N8V5_MYCAM|nr:hypothetical protein QYF61_004339 [Mycteria americana]
MGPSRKVSLWDPESTSTQAVTKTWRQMYYNIFALYPESAVVKITYSLINWVAEFTPQCACEGGNNSQAVNQLRFAKHLWARSFNYRLCEDFIQGISHVFGEGCLPLDGDRYCTTQQAERGKEVSANLPATAARHRPAACHSHPSCTNKGAHVVVRTMPECPEILVLIVPVLINWRFSPSYFFSLPSMPHKVGGGVYQPAELSWNERKASCSGHRTAVFPPTLQEVISWSVARAVEDLTGLVFRAAQLGDAPVIISTNRLVLPELLGYPLLRLILSKITALLCWQMSVRGAGAFGKARSVRRAGAFGIASTFKNISHVLEMLHNTVYKGLDRCKEVKNKCVSGGLHLQFTASWFLLKGGSCSLAHGCKLYQIALCCQAASPACSPAHISPAVVMPLALHSTLLSTSRQPLDLSVCCSDQKCWTKAAVLDQVLDQVLAAVLDQGCDRHSSAMNLIGWGLNHFPGQPVPTLDNPFSEGKFPNIQSKPPLAQLEAVSSRPIACYLGEETDPTSRQPPFRQAEQPQVPQPLPISLVLQTLPQLRCPSLDTFQPLNVPLVVRGPTLNTAFEVRPHQCPVQGHDHCPSPAGHAIADTSQDAIGFLGHLGTLLAHIQPAVSQHPQVLLCQAAFQPLFPQEQQSISAQGCCCGSVAAVDFTDFRLVELREVKTSPQGLLSHRGVLCLRRAHDLYTDCPNQHQQNHLSHQPSPSRENDCAPSCQTGLSVLLVWVEGVFAQQGKASLKGTIFSSRDLTLSQQKTDKGDVPSDLVLSFQRRPMVLLSRCRDPQKVFHRSERGRNVAAEPRIRLGLDHRQEPHQSPLSPTRDVMQGEALPSPHLVRTSPPVCPVDVC